MNSERHPMRSAVCKVCNATATTDDGRTPDGWYLIHRMEVGKRRFVGRACSLDCAAVLIERVKPQAA